MACNICEVVVSGPYLRHCRIPKWRGPLDLGPGAEMRQDAGGGLMRRIVVKAGGVNGRMSWGLLAQVGTLVGDLSGYWRKPVSGVVQTIPSS